jgi:flagellar basal-body rod protein FlgF
VGYTRDGEFHLNAERTLVNKAGRPVLGIDGPIIFKPEGGPISVSSDGTLVQGDAAVGKLPIYDFKDTDKLRRMGNVQPLQEMVNMITVSRAYEANQKVIISGNDLLEKAIQSLGATNA